MHFNGAQPGALKHLSQGVGCEVILVAREIPAGPGFTKYASRSRLGVGDRNHDDSARRQKFANGLECSLRLGHMIEHAEKSDYVKLPAGQIHTRKHALENLQPTLARDGDRGRGGFNAGHGPAARSLPQQVTAVAAAHVEQVVLSAWFEPIPHVLVTHATVGCVDALVRGVRGRIESPQFRGRHLRIRVQHAAGGTADDLETSREAEKHIFCTEAFDGIVSGAKRAGSMNQSEITSLCGRRRHAGIVVADAGEVQP